MNHTQHQRRLAHQHLPLPLDSNPHHDFIGLVPRGDTWDGYTDASADSIPLAGTSTSTGTSLRGLLFLLVVLWQSCVRCSL